MNKTKRLHQELEVTGMSYTKYVLGSMLGKHSTQSQEMTLKELTDKLEELDKKRGQYPASMNYYKVTVEMEVIERKISRLASKIIRG